MNVIEIKQLTRPVAIDQRMMDAGNAMIYRTVRVKLNSRKRLPIAPHTSEADLSAVHLVLVNMRFFRSY